MVLAICKIDEEPEAILVKFRDSDNDKITYRRIPFHNYFYVKEEDWEDVEFIMKGCFSDVYDVTAANGEFKKLILKNNWHRNIFRNKIEAEDVKTFEADLNSPRRFVLENPDLLNQEKLKVAFIDIETDDRLPLEREGWRGEVIAQAPILSAAVKDLKDDKTYYVRNKCAEMLQTSSNESYEQEEKKMLIQYFDYIKDYDVSFAWYGWGFDFPYLKQRAEKYGLNYKNLFMVDIDYKEVYEKYLWGTLKNLKLETVSIHELSTEIGKEDTKFKYLDEVKKLDWKELTGEEKYYYLWKNHPKVLKEYNIQDVNLMYMIEQKLNYFSLMAATAKFCNCLVSDTVFNSRAIDNALIKRHHDKNMIVVSKPNKEEVESRQGIFIGGGFTYTERGIYVNAKCYDFASHYVKTAIDTFNISNEMLVGFKEPILTHIFTEREIEYIRFCETCAKNCLDAKGKLRKDTYLKQCEEYRVLITGEMTDDDTTAQPMKTMEELMWQFVREYSDEELYNYCIKNNLSYTPADINLDTRGWKVHRHRIFKRERGILSQFANDISVERDAIKYNMTTFEYKSPEWWENEMAQLAVKTTGNSAYGVMALKAFRFFNYDIADAITTTCRAITKMTIMKTSDLGYRSPFGDTDSAYVLGVDTPEKQEALNKEYIEFYKDIAKDFNLANPVMINFEYEKTFERVIVSAKKKYYYKYLKDGKELYNCTGGYYMKNDSYKIAADLQYELCKDVLDDNFDKDVWHKKLSELKTKVYDMKLEEEHLTTTKKISKPLKDYGQPVIDGKTGKQKMRKSDGEPMYAPIPVHIRIAKQLVEQGHDLKEGDMIDYIVTEYKPKQQGIWIEEFRKNPYYCAEYIWEKIESPIIEILNIKCPELLFTHFKDLWHYTERQVKSLINKMEKEQDE